MTAVVTGIQWGKTLSGAVWLRRQCHTYTNSADNFIVTSPTYKIMQQSSLPAFLKVFEGMGRYSKVDGEFDIYGGGKIYFRTGTEPDSIVGVTNVRAVWGDEAGKFTKYFWENIEGRAAFADGRIMLTTSPYSLNWLYRELVKPHLNGDRPDVKLVAAKSIENPYFNRKVYEKRKKTMDPRAFKAMYEGSFERMQGLVYDCFDEDEIVFDYFKHERGVEYYAGIDWGFTDPFCMIVIAVTPDGQYFVVSEYYKGSQTPTDIIKVAKSKNEIYNLKAVYCDPSQPGMIQELSNVDIPAIPANNDIMQGIAKHYEMIKSGKYKILRGAAPNLLDEYSVYHWPEPKDLKPDQDAKTVRPVDQHNHAMDAIRYLSIHVFGIHQNNEIITIQETTPHLIIDNTKDRIKRLLSNNKPKYERFS